MSLAAPEDDFSPASRTEQACYHCGLPVPAGSNFQVQIAGQSRPMCCAGCEAVASTIVAAGLDGYYERRDRYPESPREAVPSSLQDLKVFDQAALQQQFSREARPHEREATLILEGVTCPACVWLTERHLSQQPGLVAAHINYTTNRATVRWDTRRATLSDILAAVSAIGYRAYPYDAKSLEAVRKREARSLLARFAIAGLGMTQVMMYALPGYLSETGGLEQELDTLMNWAALMLTLPVVFYSSVPFMSGAWRDLRNHRVGMDVPVALAIMIAFAASVLAMATRSGAVYFDSIAMFVFFLLGARYLEMRARHSAASQLEALSHALPATARKLPRFPASMRAELVPAAALQVGDNVLVAPGDTFPADGSIIQGESEVDEALLSGESRPLEKRRGERVIGGAVNRGNPLVVRVEQVGEQTILSAIVRLMERASQSRPRLEQIADRIAAHFVGAVLIVAVGTAFWWMFHDAARAVPVVVSVLIVSCPCALALATPMALAVASGGAARRGVLVTRSHALEALARATHCVIDKTGTLTVGRPQVQSVHPLGMDGDEALALAGALEQGSEHPLALALHEYAASDKTCTDIRNVPGQGIEAVLDGRKLRIGRKQFVAQLADDAALEDDLQAPVWLGDEQGLLAAFDLRDPLRPDASSFIASLRALGIETTLLSGDSEALVADCARQLGIARWRASMSPEDKLKYVSDLQARGTLVAMIGDGVNDAPVLAQAQVAIAPMSGAALAHGAADMVLLSGRLLDLARLVRYARRTLRIVRQNLSWALGYNAIAIPLAMLGYVTPWMAAIGMSASSVLVVANALRLMRPGRTRRPLLAGD